MQVRITQAIKNALTTLHDVPDNLRARLDAIAADGGGYSLKLSEDDATALAELVQWHIRTDAGTHQPTAETAPYAELVRLIDEAQL